MNLVRSIALSMMSGLMLGVLKGSSLVAILATVGLCIALIPLGVQVLRSGPTPGFRRVVGWSALMAGLLAAMYFLGQAG
ncbi:hypothetical protein [Spirosoma sp. KNUC1025]|uniref:hypothetical protein n=1 Tax=Spirosoma sp. KNUC1025 TaxID=2894082 RepID=UPI0038684248|nr:hypothetical protein LN737_27170 [Spirosoma sp. KNUC1025]